MKFKNIFHGRKKKARSQKDLEQVTSEESTLLCNSSGDPESSTVSLEDEQLPKDFYLKKYSESIDGSAMAIFARMSSTIADNLTEKEFGKQKNNLYRPNTNSYPSKVVHPVVCKRDIFVESVTPTKPKDRRSKNVSIYHVNDKELYMDSGKQNGGDTEATVDEAKKLKKRVLFPDIQNPANERNTKPELMHANKTRNEGRSKEPKLFFANNGNGPNDTRRNLAPYSVSASMLFRERKKLSVETGRITADDTHVVPTNPYRLHTHVDHNYMKMTRDWTKFPKFAGTQVSPSSTVSSLTIPAELDFDPTPKALFRNQIKSSPKLEGIQEISDDDAMISHNYASEIDPLLLREI